MEYCPHCGSMLMPTNLGGKVVLRCPRCGYKKEVGERERRKYVVREEILHNPHEKTVVMEEEVRTLPKVKALCPKCGHNEAYYWELQTRSADEPATRFFKCVKCGHTWREYE